MTFLAQPKPLDINMVIAYGEEVHGVEIICPVCDSERVEPLPSEENDHWECCRCGQTFRVEYE